MPSSRPKVLAVQPSLYDAQQMRMLGEIEAAGIDITRVGFSRTSAVRRPVDGIELGEVPNGRILRRLWVYFRAIQQIRSLSRSADVVVAFGSDVALLVTAASILMGSRPVVSFISDIPSQVDSGPVISRLARLVEKVAFSTSKLIVVTSEHFAHGYVNQIAPGRDWVEVRNIPSPLPAQLTGSTVAAPLTIGYFGLIRCRWSLDVLADLVRRHPDRFRVVVAGIDMLSIDLPQFCAERNMTYLGTYRSPEDLNQIYSQADIVWTGYTFGSGRRNAAWAKTNRFFEAACYGLPQIGNAATLEGADLLDAGVGIALEFGAIDDAVAEIAGVSDDGWAEIRSQAQAFSSSIPPLSQEMKPLTRAINEMAGAP